MEVGSLLAVLATVILVGAYVFQPLRTRSRSSQARNKGQLSGLQADRERLLAAIQEIDMDHSLGKIPDEDYSAQREILALQGAAVLRSIDELESDAELADSKAWLEQAVARARGRNQSADGKPHSIDPQGVTSETVDSLFPELDARTCRECGRAITREDRFCSSCGAALKEQAD